MIDTNTFINSTMPRTVPGKAPSKEIGKEMFLKLLVTQLKHQDPLNPMSDKESVAQMAQLAQLEQVTNIGKGITNVLKAMSAQQAVGASTYIGKSVQAAGNGITIKSGKPTTVEYRLGANASKVMAHIYDKDGKIVRSVKLGALSKGTHKLDWDGKSTGGKTLADGQYTVRLVAEDKNGQPLTVPTTVEGKVNGVTVDQGTVVLMLADGRKVRLHDVTKITESQQQQQAA